MYNAKSLKAEEFISDEEIMETLAYADANKDNVEMIDQIIAKAKLKKGLNHREASVLLACEIPEKVQELYDLAQQIKKDYYGNRIVLFAPLYLSNYCVNGCVYCPYHLKNKHIARKKLTQEDIVKEVTALQDMGHKRLAIEAGEDPVNNPIEYILECIKTIYSIKHKNGAIRRVNVNIAATTVENYRKLKEAGIGTYILFQETYHKASYEELHPTGPKHDYAYHTEAMDRAMEGGIDDVGLGVLFGLDKYRYEFAGLLMHAEHLEAVHGVGPHTISVPRIKHADDIDPSAFDNSISDDTFAKICALIRVAVPYTGMIISTRESQEVREKVLPLGVSQISGASMTLRFVPRFTEQIRRVAEAQQCIGRNVNNGNIFQRAAHGLKILSITTTWALENSVETADSMKSRAYGLRGRTNFSIYRFNRRDGMLLAFLVGVFGTLLFCIHLRKLKILYFPVFIMNKTTAGALLLYILYGILCMLPLILNIAEDRKWRSLRSEI